MVEDKTTWSQSFFDEVEPIKTRDPLSYILGAQADETPSYFYYTDAIKMAGHSCPAVSSAYRITQLALAALYDTETPTRGEVRVLIKGGARDLAYGPQAQVISLITGASGETGFKGLGGGRFGRNDKLKFDALDPQFCTYIFQREDTGETVKVVYDPSALGADTGISPIMPLVMNGTATAEQVKLFRALWQGKVRSILLENDKFPGLFTVESVEGFTWPS
ncbi:MAG: hypothetical protein IME99_03305 [Proteobacteria bacterium]|nr:hypothetical protein [Pseudomonadota bacterium]